MSPPLAMGAACCCGGRETIAGTGADGAGEGGRNSLTAAFSAVWGASRANSGKDWLSMRMS